MQHQRPNMQRKGNNNEVEVPNKIINGEIIQKPKIEISNRATEATSESADNQSMTGGKTPNLPQLKRQL